MVFGIALNCLATLLQNIYALQPKLINHLPQKISALALAFHQHNIQLRIDQFQRKTGKSATATNIHGEVVFLDHPAKLQ